MTRCHIVAQTAVIQSNVGCSAAESSTVRETSPKGSSVPTDKADVT